MTNKIFIKSAVTVIVRGGMEALPAHSQEHLARLFRLWCPHSPRPPPTHTHPFPMLWHFQEL